MISEKIVYREATMNDIPFMREMLIQACIGSGETAITVDNLHEYPETEININGWDIDTEPGFIAETERGESTGAVWLRNLPELGHADFPEVTIAVSIPYRKQGIASNLMNQLYRKCAEKGIKYISLGVHRENHPALLLYKKHGWTQNGTFKEYIMMSKTCL